MFNNIPVELRQLSQWACADASKKPLDPKTGKQASVSDPSSWATFEQAVAYATKHRLWIGFMLSENDPFTIIDLDDKVENPAAEGQRQRHEKILSSFDSYTERSRSGRGYHIVTRGKVPSGARRDHVEVYSDKRFMVCTGDVVREAPINDCQPLLDRLYEEMRPQFAAAPSSLPMVPAVYDKEVLSKARECYGSRFEALWDGQWESLGIGDKSQSAADLELGIMLAHFTSDENQWVRIFQASALGRRRKAQKNSYLTLTFRASRERAANDGLQGSIEHGRSIAERILARWQLSKAALSTGLLETFSTFIQKKTATLKLIRGVLGEGGLSVLYGAPGAGKSFLALDLAYAVAKGQPWMGRDTRQGPVIYAVGEGVSGLRRRAKAISVMKGGEAQQVMFLPHTLSTPDNVEKMALILGQVKAYYRSDPCLLIFDTLSRFFGEGDDENSAKDMRRFVNAIGSLQADFPGLHVMLVHHSGKDQDRGMRGSSVLQGAADTVIQCRKNGGGHLAFIEKQKDGQDNFPLPFGLEEVDLGVDDDGEPITSCVICEGDGQGLPLTGWVATAVKILRNLKQSEQTYGSDGNLSGLLVDIPLISYHNQWYRERPGDKSDTVRKNARRQLGILNNKKLIEWNGGESPIRVLPAIDNVVIE